MLYYCGVGWRCLVLPFLFSFRLYVLETVVIDVAAVGADNDNLLTKFIKLDPANFVASTEWLCDRIHCVHLSRCIN